MIPVKLTVIFDWIHEADMEPMGERHELVVNIGDTVSFDAEGPAFFKVEIHTELAGGVKVEPI